MEKVGKIIHTHKNYLALSYYLANQNLPYLRAGPYLTSVGFSPFSSSISSLHLEGPVHTGTHTSTQWQQSQRSRRQTYERSSGSGPRASELGSPEVLGTWDVIQKWSVGSGWTSSLSSSGSSPSGGGHWRMRTSLKRQFCSSSTDDNGHVFL